MSWTGQASSRCPLGGGTPQRSQPGGSCIFGCAPTNPPTHPTFSVSSALRCAARFAVGLTPATLAPLAPLAILAIQGRGEYGRLGLGENWKDRLRPTELPLTERIREARSPSCSGDSELLKESIGFGALSPLRSAFDRQADMCHRKAERLGESHARGGRGSQGEFSSGGVSLKIHNCMLLMTPLISSPRPFGAITRPGDLRGLSFARVHRRRQAAFLRATHVRPARAEARYTFPLIPLSLALSHRGSCGAAGWSGGVALGILVMRLWR